MQVLSQDLVQRFDHRNRMRIDLRNGLLAYCAKLCDDGRMTTDLDVQVQAALKRRRGDWRGISERAGVSHSWISQFVRGLIPNPGYATLKKLAVELSEADATERQEVRDAA
jgi:transcriptional regulator with XRE-family HTH domain